jgi:hypothetical protein
MLQITCATSYIGCMGKDKFRVDMKKNSKAIGVNVTSIIFNVVHFHCFILSFGQYLQEYNVPYKSLILETIFCVSYRHISMMKQNQLVHVMFL